jgi:hypothetical protein
MTMEDIDKQIVENPITKEEAREQFVRMTEYFGLKHTFTFDEAWEATQELKRRREYRENVAKFQEECLKNGSMHSGEIVDEYNPLKHSFADGMYIREIINPKNQLLVTKIHKQKHPFFLLYGKMSIVTENGVEHLEGPSYGITSPGTKRIIYTHTECKFVTVQRTDKTDLDEIEEELICKDFSDPAVTSEDLELLMGGFKQ